MVTHSCAGSSHVFLGSAIIVARSVTASTWGFQIVQALPLLTGLDACMQTTWTGTPIELALKWHKELTSAPSEDWHIYLEDV